jgi:hypothetical protein
VDAIDLSGDKPPKFLKVETVQAFDCTRASDEISQPDLLAKFVPVPIYQ